MEKQSENVIYEGKRLKLKISEYLKDGQTVQIENVDVKDSVVIVAVKYNGNILLVEEERPVIDKMTLACPAGLIEENEKPVEAARRELEEETGYAAEKLTFLRKTYTSCGYSNEAQYFYLAENLYVTEQHPDPNEFIDVKEYTPQEVMEMIADGTIDTSSAVIGLLDYFLKRG